jgi:3-dehydroquinate synthase
VEGLDDRSIPWQVLHIHDGDAHKTLASAIDTLERVAATGATRDTAVVTVGGGVTGDLGGFVASMYLRGVPWCNVPTTLLAQVDASIGGKVGVNAAGAKNAAGAFYQPFLVLADPDVLATLPPREVACGMAEVVKTAMIGDAHLYHRLRSAARDGREAGPDLLAECVVACARVKGRIVEADPWERDLRRALNLGHTVGHALEAALGPDVLRHGEAVALGLLAALRLALARGDASPAYLEEVSEILAWSRLPVESPAFEASSVRALLARDKKNLTDGLRFVVPCEPGRVTIERVAVDDVVRAATSTKGTP